MAVKKVRHRKLERCTNKKMDRIFMDRKYIEYEFRLFIPLFLTRRDVHVACDGFVGCATLNSSKCVKL